MQIPISGKGDGDVSVLVEVTGNWLELGERARRRLFTVIDTINAAKDRAVEDFKDEYGR